MRRIYLVLFAFFALFSTSCTHDSASSISSDNILVYSTQSISEESSNDGTFNSVINITVKGTEFNNGLIEGVDYGTIDLPDGLTADLEINSETEATLTISGMASSHSFCADTSMEFFFASTAFSDSRLPISFEVPISISWFNPALEFSTSLLTEDASNDGTISDTFTITATGGGQFLHNGSSTTTGILLADGIDFTWELPDGYTAVLNPDPVSPHTVINVSILGTPDIASPVGDITSELKFITGKGVGSDYCETDAKKKIDVEFQRTIVMYAVPVPNGNVGGKSGATSYCYLGRPELPEDYADFVPFLSFDVANEIQDLPGQGVPTDIEVESVSGLRIGTDFSDLTDGDGIIQPLTDAEVTDSHYFTGSNDVGALGAENCNAFTSNSTMDTSQVGNETIEADATWLNDGLLDAEEYKCSATDHVILCLAYPS